MRCLSSWDIFKPMNLNYVKKKTTALSVWTLRDNFSTLEQYTSMYLFSFFAISMFLFSFDNLVSLRFAPLPLSTCNILHQPKRKKKQQPLFRAISPLPSVHFCVGFWEGEKKSRGGRGKWNGCFPSNMWPLLSSQLKIIWVYRPVDGWLVRTSSSSSRGESLCWWLAEGKLWASNWKHDIWAI